MALSVARQPREPVRLALVIAISDYDKLVHLPGAAKDMETARRVLPAAGYACTFLPPRVTRRLLEKEIADFALQVEQAASADENASREVLVFVAYSGHGIQRGLKTLPSLLCSERPSENSGLGEIDADEVFSVFIGINRKQGFKGLHFVFAFDCCRKTITGLKEPELWCYSAEERLVRIPRPEWTKRTACPFPEKRNDYMILLGCQSGEEAAEPVQSGEELGGLLMQAVLHHIPDRKDVETLAKDSVRTALSRQKPCITQRPELLARVGRTGVSVGQEVTQHQEPEGSSRASVAASTDTDTPWSRPRSSFSLADFFQAPFSMMAACNGGQHEDSNHEFVNADIPRKRPGLQSQSEVVEPRQAGMMQASTDGVRAKTHTACTSSERLFESTSGSTRRSTTCSSSGEVVLDLIDLEENCRSVDHGVPHGSLVVRPRSQLGECEREEPFFGLNELEEALQRNKGEEIIKLFISAEDESKSVAKLFRQWQAQLATVLEFHFEAAEAKTAIFVVHELPLMTALKNLILGCDFYDKELTQAFVSVCPELMHLEFLNLDDNTFSEEGAQLLLEHFIAKKRTTAVWQRMTVAEEVSLKRRARVKSLPDQWGYSGPKA